MKLHKTKYVTRLLIIGFSLVAVMLFSHGSNAQAVKRIEFDKGKSSATVRGVTGQNGIAYIVRARSGQKLVLTLSPGANVGIKVEGSGRFGRTVLLREERGGTYEVGLEESGDYKIFVGSTSHRSLPFRLSVRIDRMAEIRRYKEMTDVQLMTETDALKAKLKATWEAGDFGEIAKSFEAGAEEFVAGLDLKPGTRVLDVACGNGNTAIPAAKAGAVVTGIDLVPYLVEQAVTRAQKDGVAAKFEVGDVESLPYPDGSFDVVVTMFGAMFAPRPYVVVSELMRVTRSGGLVAMVNWTPSGFIGQMFKATGKHVSPPASMPSPLLWGDEETVRERFADQAADLKMARRDIEFNFPFGPKETVEHFRKFYGPTQKAFQAIDANGQSALRADLEDLWTSSNIAQDGTTRVLSEYLDVRAVKK